MSRKFKCDTIPSKWLDENGRRLDCGPYMSGAIEAREIINNLRASKEPLSNLTEDIINPGRIPRNWVTDPEHGILFLTSSDILQADLSCIRMIAKSAIKSNPKLIIKKNSTLITRSGSIGRLAYARSEMDRMACTEDVLRVIPDENVVKPGYLYAYLGSCFGIPLVISGTYGAIIQHIEPAHIADLPVPRLGEVEDQAHELVQRAADLRADASQLLSIEIKKLEEEIGAGPVQWKHLKSQSFACGTKLINSSRLRLDAFHHVGYADEALQNVHVPLIEFSQVGRALLPPFLKRIWVEEEGYEFLGGAELMTMEQTSGRFISSKIRTIDKFMVKPGYVLYPCVGQRYGIFGRSVLANRHLIGKAVSQAVMRLIPNDPKDAGYVSIYLATGFGMRLCMRFSAGSSIPALGEEDAAKTPIYWPEEPQRHAISEIAEKAWESRARATELEDEARKLVENAIKEGGR